MDCTQSLHIAMCTYDIVYYVSVWCGSVVVHVLCVCMYVIVHVYLSAGEGGETTICPEGPVAMKRPQCILLPPPCLLHHAPPPMYTFVQGELG